MRGTVLVADALLLFPALLLMCRALVAATPRGRTRAFSAPSLLLLAVLAPAMILIDHGHFQYNGIR